MQIVCVLRWSRAACVSKYVRVCADDHVPDTGRRLGALPAGLRQQRAGLRPSLPLAPTPVASDMLYRGLDRSSSLYLFIYLVR